MKFEIWLAERNQRDATKKPERKTDLELHIRAAKKNAHEMVHGKAGPMDSDNRRQKGTRGKNSRRAIDRSSEEG
jgi:hypothetical protein